jgi:hypothetical protein
MSAKRHDKNNEPKAAKRTAPHDVPQFSRLNIEVGDLQSAILFYTKLLGVEGRRQAGSRCYFNCGPVTLQVLDVSSTGQPHPAAKALYFTVNDLETAYDRPRLCSVSRVRTSMTHRAAASWFGPGASGPSTRRTLGRTDCALSRRERSTQGRFVDKKDAGCICATPQTSDPSNN